MAAEELEARVAELERRMDGAVEGVSGGVDIETQTTISMLLGAVNDLQQQLAMQRFDQEEGSMLSDPMDPIPIIGGGGHPQCYDIGTGVKNQQGRWTELPGLLKNCYIISGGICMPGPGSDVNIWDFSPNHIVAIVISNTYTTASITEFLNFASIKSYQEDNDRTVIPLYHIGTITTNPVDGSKSGEILIDFRNIPRSDIWALST